MLLLRHGKSKRGPEYETDFERPLAKRGKRDAASMGEFLAAHDLLPDIILSSPAERAMDELVRGWGDGAVSPGSLAGRDRRGKPRS